MGRREFGTQGLDTPPFPEQCFKFICVWDVKGMNISISGVYNIELTNSVFKFFVAVLRGILWVHIPRH